MKVRFVQFQVVIEEVYQGVMRGFKDEKVIYGLDQDGQLWRRPMGSAWKMVPMPEVENE
jgi:hypothetical protein